MLYAATFPVCFGLLGVLLMGGCGKSKVATAPPADPRIVGTWSLQGGDYPLANEYRADATVVQHVFGKTTTPVPFRIEGKLLIYSNQQPDGGITQQKEEFTLDGDTLTFIDSPTSKRVFRRGYPQVPEATLKGVTRTVYDSPQPTQAQLARKAKSIAALKAMGLPYIDHLPVVEDETLVRPRTAQEVAQRCLAITICAVKGESKGEDPQLVERLVKRYSAAGYFSPEEGKFIRNPRPTQQSLVDSTWEYECVHTLLWALGHSDTLKPPNAICHVAHDVALIRDVGAAAFVGKARLRAYSEILDMADLYYRLHWAAIELRLKGKGSEQIDEGIIRERHRALNWLIRYMNQEWDEVTTDT